MQSKVLVIHQEILHRINNAKAETHYKVSAVVYIIKLTYFPSDKLSMGQFWGCWCSRKKKKEKQQQQQQYYGNLR